MFWNVDTISKRLFLSFSILAVNIVILSALSFHFFIRERDTHQLSLQIDAQQLQTARLLKIDLDFLRFETINQNFYSTHESEFLTKRDSVYQSLCRQNKKTRENALLQSLGIQPSFDSLDLLLIEYNKTFNVLKQKMILRGFKDYGQEGIMRKYAHQLEYQTEIGMIAVLTLRRHEKDYFLRREDQYKKKFNAEAAKVLATLISNRATSEIVSAYVTAFNHLAAMDETIGLTPRQGFVGKLNKQSETLASKYENLAMETDQLAFSYINRSRIIYASIALLCIIISFALTYATALRLTHPIKKLSATISKFVVTKGLHTDDLVESGASMNEVSTLSSSFITMARKLRAQFSEIEKKSAQLEKNNKELKKLNHELDRFIYSAAHDLKSPLVSLEGLVYLAKREINAGEHAHYFDKMNSSIDKMMGFIGDITDYAKNKRQRVMVDNIQFNPMIDGIFESLQFIPHANEINKVIHIDPGEFHTDRARLEIVLKNVISNAIRYGEPSRSNPYIHISIRVLPAKTTIQIEDNGIGIEDTHLPHIFDMFYRATSSAKGSGIGLYLVRESVKMLRGTINVKSELGIGTTFTVALPNLKKVRTDLPESEPVKVLSAAS